MVPAYIHNLMDFAKVVQLGHSPETRVLEFKKTIEWKLQKGTTQDVREKIQKEVCRDIAQFANTDGGCLLIGIDERIEPGSSLHVAASICPVEEPDKMKQWIEQAIRRYLVPATFRNQIVILKHSEGSVLAINIEPSLHLVALEDSQGKIEYLRRTSHGKEWLHSPDVERHLMNGSRAAKLSLEAAYSEATVKGVVLAGGHWTRPPGQSSLARWTPQGAVTVGRITDHWFELRIPTAIETQCVNVPYGVVREVWVGADGRLNLLLSVRLVQMDAGYFIE